MSESETRGILSLPTFLETVGRIGRPSGRGLLMFRTLAIATSTAAVVGVCAASFGGMFMLGGIQFFVLGSSIGFVGGSFGFYWNQVAQAFEAFRDYPELMRLHLIMNFPMARFQRMDLRVGNRSQELQKFEQSSALTSMLASAYQTARPTIDELLLRQEQLVVDDLVRRHPFDTSTAKKQEET